MDQEKEEEEMSEDLSGWMQYLSNPHGLVLKQYVANLLPIKYKENEPIIERISAALQTKEDMERFGRLVADLYEAGFFRAVANYQKELSKLGIKAEITTEVLNPKPSPKIFD